jgi:hypothetical protein
VPLSPIHLLSGNAASHRPELPGGVTFYQNIVQQRVGKKNAVKNLKFLIKCVTLAAVNVNQAPSS